MDEQKEQIGLLTDAVHDDAATLFNRLGEIRQGLADGEDVSALLTRLSDFQQHAAWIVLNLKEMRECLKRVRSEKREKEQ